MDHREVRILGSSVCVETRLLSGTGVQFPAESMVGFLLFATASRPDLAPTQPPIQWVPGAFTPGVKWPGRKADHLPPSSAEVKNLWRYTSTPQYVVMAWCLVKRMENFALFAYTV